MLSRGALPLIGAFVLLVGVSVLAGSGLGSWELVYVRPDARPAEGNAIYIADVQRGVSMTFNPPDSTQEWLSGRYEMRTMALSPDRRQIIRAVLTSPVRLFLVDLTSGVANDIGTGNGPMWSPDGQYVAYLLDGQVYTVRLADGTPGRPVQVTRDDWTAHVRSRMAWSPAGDRLAIEMIPAAGGFSDIFTVRPDGSGWANLTETPNVDDLHPTFSPDGNSIAFIRERLTTGPAIHVVALDGTSLRVPIDAPGGSYPVWSPDGTRIAYLALNPDTRRFSLMVALADRQTRPVALTPIDYPAQPLWSPDGTQLAYFEGSSSPGIHIIDVQTRASRPLARDFNAWLP
jgi:Tol biopolymer transport system component